MNWLAFSICAAAGWIAQTTAAPWTAIGGLRPDWVFVLVIFFALYARRSDAILAGWILGLGVDLLSAERLGLFALVYCLLAVGVNAIRDYVFLKHAGTHFVVTLAAGVLAQSAFVAYRCVTGSLASEGVGRAIVFGCAVAVYSAAWAPPIHHLFLKVSGLFGLHTSRYSHRSLSVAGGSRV